MLDALRSEALEERVEPRDSEGDPGRSHLRRVQLDEETGALVDLPENLFPDAMVWGSPEERVYQSMLASRSDTGIPATSWAESDAFLTLASGQRLATRIGRHIDHVIPQSGHALPEDQGQVISKLIIEWLDGCD